MAEAAVDNGVTKVRFLPGGPNFYVVVEGKEWSPAAVTRGLTGATPADHPKIEYTTGMPHVDPSWRQWPQWKWFSRLFCYFGRHHWLKSKSLKENLICVVCAKETPHMAEYRKLKQL